MIYTDKDIRELSGQKGFIFYDNHCYGEWYFITDNEDIYKLSGNDSGMCPIGFQKGGKEWQRLIQVFRQSNQRLPLRKE